MKGIVTMSKSNATLQRSDEVIAESLVETLVNLPRVKIDLIELADGIVQHFIIRKVKFFAADNVKGTEIKLTHDGARNLLDALKRRFPQEPQAAFKAKQ